MNSEYREKDKLLVIHITEEMDHHIVEKIKGEIDNEMERRMPRKVVFDFGGVTFMDSAGIGMIIGRYKTAALLGAKVEMTQVKNNVKKIFEMSGVSRIIPTIENVG